MSNVKLLINEVFKKGEYDSGKNKKYPLALYLKVHLETFKLFKDEKTFVRYYDAYVLEIKKEIDPDLDTLDKLSRYIGYENFTDFSNTFIKKDEESIFTEVKVSVDGNEFSKSKANTDVNISITNINKPSFPGKEFIVKNGLGILEMTFVLLLVTGGVVFSNGKKLDNTPSMKLGFFSNSNLDTENNYMYWDGEQFNPTDSSYIGPEFEVIAMDKRLLLHQRRITRKDTMTVENSLGRTWYSKYYGNVEFFTADGIDPDNKKELKKSTPFMIEKYAGKNADSIQSQ